MIISQSDASAFLHGDLLADFQNELGYSFEIEMEPNSEETQETTVDEDLQALID